MIHVRPEQGSSLSPASISRRECP